MIFDAEDIEEYMEDHNDPPVITLPVAGCNVKKILIDGGSSVNVLFYDTFKRMELNDEQLMSSYYTIFGFNGAPTKPLGDIVLEVRAGRLKIETRFSVVDAPSPYNAIIGRRWVHKLKGVEATYHQYLRFPTPEGVMKIKGDQVPENAKLYKTNSTMNKMSSGSLAGEKTMQQLRTRQSTYILKKFRERA
ncbi:uncharacterized protein LOC113291527 [Papaver somniferum]|uniref:uncharacterized protein LOC113291527 n=1 Tax=Papaver somniferum TaxID=3469 RepID=UPI000E6FAC0F|nr:uncharacterized protein LOC113291527 [Papaver somniferum]